MHRLISTLFSKPSPIKLYWWKYGESIHGNFGDEITRLIIEKNFNRKVEWASPDQAELIATGSILDILLQEKKDNHPYVWGSGFIEDKPTSLSYNDSRVVGVRGKLTLARITDIPSHVSVGLGDPGLLASTLLEGTPTPKRYKLGIVPHYVDSSHSLVARLSQLDDVLIIDPTADCLDVIKTIGSCDNILSSSLHGLIVADSLGVPNLHIELSDKLRGGDYKFKDYYSVFAEERYNKIPQQVINGSIEDIVRHIRLNYVEPSNIDEVKASIKASFPLRGK